MCEGLRVVDLRVDNSARDEGHFGLQVHDEVSEWVSGKEVLLHLTL